MSSVLAVPNTNTSVVVGPDGSGHGFAIGLTCPVAAADTTYTATFGGNTNAAFIGAGVSDMTAAVTPRVMNEYFHGWSTAWYDPFPGAPTDGGSAGYGDRGVIGWSPNFGAGLLARPLGRLLPVCDDNAEYVPVTPLQGFTGPSAMILGGSECEAKAEVITLNSATGNQSVTGVGFEPDFLLFLGCCAFPINDLRDGTNGMVGAAGYADNGSGGKGALTQWVGCTRARFFSGPGNKQRRWHQNACIAHIGETQFGGATTVNQLASIVSMDADGYTINLSAAGLDTAGVASKVIVLAVRVTSGAGIRVGNAQQGDTTLTPGFQPDAMMFASSQNTLLGTNVLKAYFQLGCVDAANERSFWEGCNDGIVTSEGYVSTVSSLRFAETGGVLRAEANCTFPGSGPDVNLNWTTDDGFGIYFGWVAFQVDSVKNPLPGCIQFIPQIYRLIKPMSSRPL